MGSLDHLVVFHPPHDEIMRTPASLRATTTEPGTRLRGTSAYQGRTLPAPGPCDPADHEQRGDESIEQRRDPGRQQGSCIPPEWGSRRGGWVSGQVWCSDSCAVRGPRRWGAGPLSRPVECMGWQRATEGPVSLDGRPTQGGDAVSGPVGPISATDRRSTSRRPRPCSRRSRPAPALDRGPSAR